MFYVKHLRMHEDVVGGRKLQELEQGPVHVGRAVGHEAFDVAELEIEPVADGLEGDLEPGEVLLEQSGRVDVVVRDVVELVCLCGSTLAGSLKSNGEAQSL